MFLTVRQVYNCPKLCTLQPAASLFSDRNPEWRNGCCFRSRRGFTTVEITLALNCRYQALALKFRLLSIHFTSEVLATGRKMSAMGILRQACTPQPVEMRVDRKSTRLNS